jgi:hypothetical protein
MFEDQTVELLPARTVMSHWGGGGGGGGGRNGGGGGGGRAGDVVANVSVNIESEGDVESTVTINQENNSVGGAGGAGGEDG